MYWQLLAKISNILSLVTYFYANKITVINCYNILF